MDPVPVLAIEHDLLRVEVAPAVGGRVVRLVYKPLDVDFLWRNDHLALAVSPPGAPYDPNFYGGIDEVIPGDLPEQIDGLENPDHGELWTLRLRGEVAEDGQALVLNGLLPRWQFHYTRQMRLRPGEPWIDVDYTIQNNAEAPRMFLWKLHAALSIAPGDEIICPAKRAVVADPDWSRWKVEEPFAWPMVNGQRADRIPAQDGTTDFLFLYDLEDGWIGLRRPETGVEFGLAFDRNMFPCACYFASYGGLDGHYTAVLEPATAMPVSVNEAAHLGNSAWLAPGDRLQTRISIYAGPLRA